MREPVFVDIDYIEAGWLSTVVPDIVSLEGDSGTPLTEVLGLAPRPVSRVSAYCASGMEAVRGGAMAIAAGEYELVIVAGVEKMRDVPPRGSLVQRTGNLTHPTIAKGRSGPGGFAMVASRYLDRYDRTADDLAARLAALAPELTRLNEGAAVHGVPETVRRAEEVQGRAEAIRAEAAELPGRVAEIDKRLVSLRTRAQALATRAGQVGPVLSELRRRFSAACWQDLQQVPDRAAADVERAERMLDGARRARAEQRWPDALAALASVRELLDGTDRAVSAAGDRLRRLDEVSRDPQGEIERTRFALRDAQRLAMQGRTRPDPRHAGPLDDAVARLDRAVEGLTGRHPDYWAFLTETAAVRQAAERVVAAIREERAGHR